MLWSTCKQYTTKASGGTNRAVTLRKHLPLQPNLLSEKVKYFQLQLYLPYSYLFLQIEKNSEIKDSKKKILGNFKHMNFYTLIRNIHNQTNETIHVINIQVGTYLPT